MPLTPCNHHCCSPELGTLQHAHAVHPTTPHPLPQPRLQGFAGVFSPDSDWQAPAQEEPSSGRSRGRSSAKSEDSWYAGSFDGEEGGSGSSPGGSDGGSGSGGAPSAFQPGQEVRLQGLQTCRAGWAWLADARSCATVGAALQAYARTVPCA